MKRTIIVIIVAAITLSACKKERNQNNGESLVTKAVLQAGTNDSIVRTSTYDAINKVIQINQSANQLNVARVYKFVYSADGSLSYFDDNALGRYRFERDGSGRIVSQKNFIMNGNVETLKQNTNYSYDGTTVTENYTPETSNGYINIYSYDANGNTTSVKRYNKASRNDTVGTLVRTTSYGNYDNKKHASSFPKEVSFPLSSVNNVGIITYSPSDIDNYVYEYNTDGYPVKATRNTTSTTLYTYRKL